jgi:hypothetical protein
LRHCLDIHGKHSQLHHGLDTSNFRSMPVNHIAVKSGRSTIEGDKCIADGISKPSSLWHQRFLQYSRFSSF